jgi:hypothetical protein
MLDELHRILCDVPDTHEHGPSDVETLIALYKSFEGEDATYSVERTIGMWEALAPLYGCSP